MNQFIDVIGYRTFALTATHIRLLTGYITILFNRTRSRRAASDGQNNMMIEALRALLSDDQKLSELAAKQTLEMIGEGYPLRRTVTKKEIVAGIEREITRHASADDVQRSYIQTMETMMAFADENMLNGHWGIVHTEPDEPFVIGDAPVVTWERTEGNILNFGLGFARPNVEVLLPVSPTACLHVLPLVERSRPVRTPATQEVNMAQAAFASEHCFTNVHSRGTDAVLQPQFGKVRLGIEGFSLRHIDYKKLLFDILMGRRPQ